MIQKNNNCIPTPPNSLNSLQAQDASNDSVPDNSEHLSLLSKAGPTTGIIIGRVHDAIADTMKSVRDALFPQLNPQDYLAFANQVIDPKGKIDSDCFHLQDNKNQQLLISVLEKIISLKEEKDSSDDNFSGFNFFDCPLDKQQEIINRLKKERQKSTLCEAHMIS